MAPIKMEENIKDRIGNRRINPSNGAWEKLAARLDENENKTNKKYFWWIGIAASIVGILLVYNFVFNTSNSELVPPTIVDSPLEKSIENSEIKSNEIIVSNPEPSASKEKEMNSQLENPTVTSKTLQKETVNVVDNQNNLAFINERINKSEKSNDPVLIEKQEEKVLIEDTILAEASGSSEMEMTALDFETNSLLDNAQKKIKDEKIISKGNSTIDPVSLLADVENDLEETFRDKFFNSIVSGYNTIRVAFAERNE